MFFFSPKSWVNPFGKINFWDFETAFNLFSGLNQFSFNNTRHLQRNLLVPYFLGKIKKHTKQRSLTVYCCFASKLKS